MPKRRLGAARAGAALAVPVLLGATAAPATAHFLRPAPAPARQQAAAVGDHDLDNVFAEQRLVTLSRASRGAPRDDPATAPAIFDTGVRLRPARGAVTGSFGEGRSSHRHPGVDFDGETGDPVIAASAGVVEIAGFAGTGYSGYGRIVLIDHGNGVETLYAHLSAATVHPGQSVAAGERIGAIGTTGNVTGSHLHFEVHLGGRRVNPLAWLQGAG